MPEPKRAKPKLKTPWLRVMAVLADGKHRTQAWLVRACGFSPISGTIRTALNGIREGSSSGKAHAGLVALGLVERTELDIDGVVEVAYAITDVGKRALESSGGTLPPLKDRDESTNVRFKNG